MSINQEGIWQKSAAKLTYSHHKILFVLGPSASPNLPHNLQYTCVPNPVLVSGKSGL